MIDFGDGGASFGDCDLLALCAARETPLFVYHLGIVKERVAAVRRAFGESTELLYAVKANPHPELLAALRSELDGLDISSSGELERALGVGYEASELSFTGPAKAASAIERALELGIDAFCAESREELIALASLARARGLSARVRLRINPETPIHAYALGVGGGPSPFGLDAEELGEAAATLREQSDVLELIGSHHFVGSQCLSARALTRHVEQSLSLARKLEHAFGAPLSSINLGGGFGVPGPGKRPLDLEALGRETARRFDAWAQRAGRRPGLVLELGRYLVGPAGLYISTVQRIKRSRGESFVIVDGGIHHLLAASGVYSADHAMMQVFNLDNPRGPVERVQVAGRLCTPFDRLARDALLPRVRVGDRLAFGPAGAYGASASPGAFLGHPPAGEVLC